MATRLRGPFRDYDIKASHEVGPADEPAIFPDQCFAESFLRRFVGDHMAVAGMRAAAEISFWARPLAGVSDDDVLRQLACELTMGRVRLISVPRPTPTALAPKDHRDSISDPASSIEPMPSTSPAPPPVEPAQAGASTEATSWITFELVDDESGDAVAGVNLQLKLPDGSVRTVTSDRSGVVHISDLPPGNFDVEKVFGAAVTEVVEFA